MERMNRVVRLAAQAVLPAAVLALTYVATSALLEGPDRPPAAPSERAEEVYAVTAVNVTVGANRATLRAFGEVVAGESAELRIASPGEVVEVNDALAVGNLVEKGAALVTIDPFAYEGALREARASLTEAKARLAEADARIAMEEARLASTGEQLALAERDLERAEALGRTGATSDKAVDDRRMIALERRQTREQVGYTLEAERARRAQQAAQVERLAWQVERAERALEDTVLSAPFRGIVREENVAVGRLLATNDLAVSLIRANALDVRFTLSDQRYGRLIASGALIGTPVEVVWRIGDVPLVYAAEIERVAADIASDTGGVEVFARMSLTEDGPVPRPGAFVEVRVPGPLHQDTTRLPVAALYDGDVFVIGEDDRLVERPVTLLTLDRGDAIVRGPLAEGDVVVTTRLSEAGEGLLVRRVETGPIEPVTPSLAEAAEPDVEPATPPAPQAESEPRQRS